jgi:hypothetical protein
MVGVLAGILVGVLVDSVAGIPVGSVADVLVSLTDAGGSPPCPQRLHQLQEPQARQAEELEWRVVRWALHARAGQYMWGVARYPLQRTTPKTSIQVGDNEVEKY